MWRCHGHGYAQSNLLKEASPGTKLATLLKQLHQQQQQQGKLPDQGGTPPAGGTATVGVERVFDDETTASLCEIEPEHLPSTQQQQQQPENQHQPPEPAAAVAVREAEKALLEAKAKVATADAKAKKKTEHDVTQATLQLQLAQAWELCSRQALQAVFDLPSSAVKLYMLFSMVDK